MIPALIVPTVAELRLISPSALALWRALVRVRRSSKVLDTEWFAANLRDLMRRASIMSYSTARASLGQLRSAGLVAASTCSSSRWICQDGRIESVNARGGNLYLVVGDYSSRGGIDSYQFPRRAWSEFVAGRSIGVKCRIDPWITSIQPLSAKNSDVKKGASVEHGFACRTQELDPNPCTSVIYCIKNMVEAVASKKAGCEPAYLFSSIESNATADLAGMEDDSSLSTDLGSIEIAGTSSPLTPSSSTCPYLPPDSHEAPVPTVMYVSPELVPEQKAIAVIDGFRRAVREVYGQNWWQYAKGDLKRAKGYASLVACGEQLSDHSVPAEHWAIWRLRWLKDHSDRFSLKPPPIGVVMSAKAVSEKAGWFRKDYEIPVPIIQHDPIIAEQHLRNREAVQRWRGVNGEAALILMPVWYADKRRTEIAQGFVEPHERWPTKPGSRYGRIAQ